jgi:hypothetical protein
VAIRTAAILLCLLFGGAVRAEDEEVLPPRAQALLLFRVLGYDRGLASRAGGTVTIAVLWRSGDEAARDDAVDALREMASRYRIGGQPVRAVPVRWEADSLARHLENAGASAALVVGAMGAEVGDLAALLRSRHIASATSSRSAVEAGLIIGLLRRGDRAIVAVNVAAAKAAGIDLDSTLFLVAETVKGAGAAGPP